MATDGIVAEAKKREIFGLANICEDLFSRYADPNIPLPEPKARADLQQQRFELWASYLGVFAPYNVSLDRRLEYSEEIRNLVMQLLCLVRRNLDFVLLESRKEISPVSSNHGVKELDAKPRLKGTASEALDAVEATISRLNRLGSTIRRYSTSSLETRVRAFTARYGDENYTTLAKLIVQFRYRTASPSLQEHLAVSMSDRRQKLRYMGQHQAKLASREQKTQKKQDMRTSLSPGLGQITEEEDSENVAPPEPTRNRNRKKIAFRSSQNNPFAKIFAPSDMGSKASTFKPPPSVVAGHQWGDGRSVVSSSKNSKTFMAEDLENYPEAPQKEPGKPTPCPFCSKPLEDSELKLGKWQRHVNEDLRPFVCISEKCSQPPQAFEHFEIWAKHMRDSHSDKWTQRVYKPVIWRCDLYHEEEVFADEGRFEEHLRSKHDSFSTAQRKAFSRSSRSTQRRRPNICPLCGYDVFVPNSTNPASPTQKDSTSNPTNNGETELLHKLAKHIAGHLRLLAFSSVDNLDAGSDDSSQESMKTLDMKTRDGSKTHPPSGMKYLSRGNLSFIDDPNELGDPTRQSLGHVNASNDMDPDWSTEDIASLNIAPYDLYSTEGLSLTKGKEIPEVGLMSQIMAELERGRQQESPDLILQHIYQRQAKMRMVIAVDFGTTFSAVAYASTLNPSIQKILTTWGDGGDITENTVPTVLRYDNNGTTGPYVWGFRAQKFIERGEKVHEWFKLGLCNDFEERRGRESEFIREYKSQTALPPVKGEVCKNLVISFLSGIKGAVDNLFARVDENVAQWPRDYIITVPALWDHAEQEKTRECAERAGMGEGTQLQVITAPEAACIYAIKTMLVMNVNDTFVICDAGGCTVDLASYTIESLIMNPFHCKLAGAATGSGGLCGSGFLNRIFEKYLEDKLKDYQGWDPSFMVDAMRAFENRIKPDFTGESKDEHYIRIQGLVPSERHGVERNFLTLTTTELREKVFDEVITKIQGLVRDQIAHTNGTVKEVLLAGGDTAMVRGALIAGLGRTQGRTEEVEDGFEVVSRIVGRHYGTAAYYNFEEGKDPESRKKVVIRGDGAKIEKISWFAKMGDSIRDGQPMSFRFLKLAKVRPGVPAHEACAPTVHIYACEKRIPANYKDDPTVWEIAEFKPDLRGLTIPTKLINGTEFYEVEFAIEMTLRAASLTFCAVYAKDTPDAKRFPAKHVQFR
ncbi:hypothetical protein DL98DRAFT_600035 [Cadophora sp. DSE1049]|nr:hypothetical protein DL98DRAFT_600035 [Cadophora sp. DSE1049]